DDLVIFACRRNRTGVHSRALLVLFVQYLFVPSFPCLCPRFPSTRPGGAAAFPGSPLGPARSAARPGLPEVSGVKGGRRPPRSGRRPLGPEGADRYPRGAPRAHRAAASREEMAAHAASLGFFSLLPFPAAAAYQAASCSAGGMSPIALWIRWVLNQCR